MFRLEQDLGLPADAATMLLGLSLERLLPGYEQALRDEMDAIDADQSDADAAATVVERLDALHRPVTRVLARQVLDAMDAG